MAAEPESPPIECWNCRSLVGEQTFGRSAILHGRTVSRGGPYYSFRCPDCRELWVCSRESTGNLVSRPPGGRLVVDTVISLFSSDARRHLERVRAWVARQIAQGAAEKRIELSSERESRESRDSRNRSGDRVRPHPQLARYRTLLGVDPGADRDEIREAFLARAKECHPDALTESNDQLLDEARRRFGEVREAYEKLIDAWESESEMNHDPGAGA